MAPFNSRRWLGWFVLVCLGLASPLRSGATTVIPPEFDSLVSQADYIVRGLVKSLTAEWRNDANGRSIVTKVEVDVLEVIKGTPPSPLVLEVLGGRIGKYRLIVEGAPDFIPGEEEVLFVHGNGRQFTPLVAMMYGMYPVAHDTASGQNLVLRSNGTPLYDVKEVTRPMTAANATGKAAARPLTATEFANKIRASVSRHVVTPPANAN